MVREKEWRVYLLECLDGSYYTGVTNNLEKRMAAHESGKGSKYVLSRGFCRLISSRKCLTRSEALKTEYKIKRLSKDEKLGFFNLE
jgi:putative endonuclease